MCGIIGLISRKGGEPAQDYLLEQYQEQKSRGSQGFGLIQANKESYKVKRSIEAIKAMIDVSRAKEPILILHHRLPTSTPNEAMQTHPIIVSHDELRFDYAIIHNGVITNSHELFKIHTEELGYTYRTLVKKPDSSYTNSYYYQSAYSSKFNDTEAFAIELARYIEKKTEVIGSLGSQAFMGMKINKKTKKPQSVFWGTNGRNPIVWDETPIGIVIASELEYGFDAGEGVFHEILVKDLFNPKLAKKKLIDLINYKELTFQTPPPPPKTTVVKGFSHVALPATKTIETKTASTEKKESSDGLDLKETPAGFTDREWAFRKMGLRALSKINEIVLDFYDQLPRIENGYQEYTIEDIDADDLGAPYNTPGALTQEELLDDTLVDLELALQTALTRSSKINAFYDRKEKNQETEKELTTTPTEASTTSTNPKNLDAVPKQQWLI